MTAIAIDADVLGRQRTGDEAYVANLLRELGRAGGDETFLAVTRRADLVPDGVAPVVLPGTNSWKRLGWALPRLLNRLRPGLAHFQYVIPAGYRGRSVITVHDLSFERHPELMSRRDRVVFPTFVPRACRRAERVFTVSDWSRHDILERYRLPDDKVVVTPNGVDPAFGPEGPRRGGPPYVLFVGAIQPRKDPLTAIRALARLEGDLRDLRLLMAGPHKRAVDEVRATVAELGLGHRVELLGYTTTEELAALYRGAQCLVFPSRYEGFGLPVLEAMASGIPVVAAAASALPEVAADAALLVPPGDPEALADGIRRALRDRDRLVAAGLARAAGFDWSSTAARTLAAYREVL